jgi:hypothetical protein
VNHAGSRGFGGGNVNRVFQEFALGRADGTYARLLRHFARTDILVIDD